MRGMWASGRPPRPPSSTWRARATSSETLQLSAAPSSRRRKAARVLRLLYLPLRLFPPLLWRGLPLPPAASRPAWAEYLSAPTVLALEVLVFRRWPVVVCMGLVRPLLAMVSAFRARSLAPTAWPEHLSMTAAATSSSARPDLLAQGRISSA